MTERAAALQRTLLSVENNAGGKNSTLELSDKGTTMHQIKSLMTERRVMLGTIIGLLLAMLLMLIATSTDHWARLSFLPRHRADRKVSVVGYHTGIWRICFYEIHKKDLPLPIATTSANAMNPVVSTTSALNSVSVEPTSDYNGTNPSGGSLHGFKPRLPVESEIREHCQMLHFYPSDKELEIHKGDVDFEILNYSRSETAFAIISLIMMCIGLFFSVYCLKEPRYMFKRLAALLHLISAICMLVCAEVFINSINYERKNLPNRFPPLTTFQYGFSFAFVWVAFAINVIACIIYLVLGRKLKREHARSDREAYENEPVVLGRI